MPALPLPFDVLYWGIAISNALLGFTLLQGWTYFHNNEDKLLLRLFVTSLIVLDIGNAVLATDVGHGLLVAHFGEDILDLPIPWSAPVEAVGSVLITASTQVFFASRVYLIYGGKQWVGPCIIALFTSVGFVFGILFSIHTFKHPYISNFSDYKMEVDVAAFFVLCFVSDLTTTLLLFWKFAKSFSRSSISKRTNYILQDLITTIVTRGLLVTVVVLAIIITYIYQPGSLYWTPMHFAMSRVYVITMLAMLNGRKRRQMLSDVESNSGTLTNLAFASTTSKQEPLQSPTKETGRS